ncbi:2-polyprenyl-3-methyl-5-hydroxy-6-metoxy-1,4-benzoquinol methylase [Pseudomonas sp. TE3786]
MSSDRHTYEYDVDPASQTAPAHVIRMVGEHKRVLEMGCGPGSITKLLAQQGQCRITGLEVDPEAIKRVTPFCESVISADLNASDWPLLLAQHEKFDVVVAADVLEHLYDPWRTLQRMVPLISADGYLVISLPHAGHAAISGCLYDGDFDYRDWGLLDRTHIRFFGLKNIEALFAQAGLKIIEARYVIKPPEETEFAPVWATLPGSVRKALSSSRHAHVYQVVVKAVPVAYAGAAVALLPPAPKPTRISSHTALSMRVRRALGPRAKQFLRKGAGLLGIKL